MQRELLNRMPCEGKRKGCKDEAGKQRERYGNDIALNEARMPQEIAKAPGQDSTDTHNTTDGNSTPQPTCVSSMPRRKREYFASLFGSDLYTPTFASEMNVVHD